MTFFQNILSITLQKINENWKYTEKLLKMSESLKSCNFWAISTCNTSKKCIFYIELNFKQKKYDLFFKNLNFLHCFQINHTFLFYTKNAFFFEVLHVEIAQKLQIMKISPIFSNFSLDFQFFLFLGDLWKKNPEKGSNELELKPSFRETWFLGKFSSRAKINRGGSRSPSPSPPHLARPLRRRTD